MKFPDISKSALNSTQPHIVELVTKLQQTWGTVRFFQVIEAVTIRDEKDTSPYLTFKEITCLHQLVDTHKKYWPKIEPMRCDRLRKSF